MKHLHIKTFFLILLCATGVSGCFKNYKEDFMFRESQIEFDAATFESKAPGKTYPILGPLDKGSGIKTYKVNLLGEQKPAALTLQFRVVAGESTAVEGLHYRLPSNGTFEIPANSSTGQVEVEILDFPSETGTATLVLELVGGDAVKASENYKRLGISISLVGPPTVSYPLLSQLGSSSFYNTIAVDLMHPGMSPDFLTRWNAMKVNLNAFSTGGRTPYNLQFRFDDDHKVRVTLIYTTAGVTFSYAYASWIYTFEPNAQGIGKFVFAEAVDANGTNLLNAGVTDPILKNWLEQYDFKVEWVPSSVATPRSGAYIGGVFRADDASSYVFGELNYITFNSNTPRPAPSSPHINGLFSDGNGGLYSSLLIDPNDPGQSQDFKDRWAQGKAAVQGSGGRQLNQMLFTFDPTFYDAVLVMAYANAASTSKLIGKTHYWIRMSHNAEMKLEYIFRDGNAGATSPAQIFSTYLDAEEFKITRSGDKLTFISKNNPASFFVGTLGNLPGTTASFSWWF